MSPAWGSSPRNVQVCSTSEMVSDVRARQAGRKVTFTEHPLQAHGCPCRLRAGDDGAHGQNFDLQEASRQRPWSVPTSHRHHEGMRSLPKCSSSLSYLFRLEDRDQSRPVDETLISL